MIINDNIEMSNNRDIEIKNPIIPSPPPVPLEAFPSSVADMLLEAGKAFGVPTQIPTACLLSLLSCLVGRSRLISIKESWCEAGNLWIAIVATSGMGKSPLISAFFRCIDQLEHEEKRKYEIKYKEYAESRSEDHASEESEPIQRQALVDDVTVEALGEILKNNPKGLLWLRDELSGLIFDFDRYASNGDGGTKSRLLSAYDCQRWKTNRVSNVKRNIDIPKACVGIFGGVQPGLLSKVFRAGEGGLDQESGFLARFVFLRAEAEAPSYWSDCAFSCESNMLLNTIAANLWGWEIEYDKIGREKEMIVPVSDQAKLLYINWYNAIAEEAFVSQNAALLSKLRGQAQRLCLLLHSLDAALAGDSGMYPVSENCMRRALSLANWAKDHQEQCWQLYQPKEKAKQPNPIERAIMTVIVRLAKTIATDGWRISNADLFPAVKDKLNMPELSN